MMLTEEEGRFAKKFKHAVSKIDKPRQIVVRHVSDRGVSMKKQGPRKHDVKSETLKNRLLDFRQGDVCSADQLTQLLSAWESP